MELINKAAALDALERYKDVSAFACVVVDCMDIVEDMPTVDAVEVVRCEDCKYFDSEDDCGCPMDVRYSDFFCKMGERRTDG